MEIIEASAKVRTGPPLDDERLRSADLGGHAGFRAAFYHAEARSALASGIRSGHAQRYRRVKK